MTSKLILYIDGDVHKKVDKYGDSALKTRPGLIQTQMRLVPVNKIEPLCTQFKRSPRLKMQYR